MVFGFKVGSIRQAKRRRTGRPILIANIHRAFQRNAPTQTDGNDAMQVVRHDDKGVQFNPGPNH